MNLIKGSSKHLQWKEGHLQLLKPFIEHCLVPDDIAFAGSILIASLMSDMHVMEFVLIPWSIHIFHFICLLKLTISIISPLTLFSLML